MISFLNTALNPATTPVGQGAAHNGQRQPVSAACQVVDLNGCRAASRTAGHTHPRQVPHLLHPGCLLGDQPGPARSQVPQPRPGLIGRLGQVTAQLPGQPGDQDRVLASVLPEVRSSARRACELISGCTHTNGICRSAAS